MLLTLHPRRVSQATPENHRLPSDPNEAFELVYQRYSEPIASWLLRRLNGDTDLALDLRDEVFLRVWQALPSWHERGIVPKSWLYRIAHARLVDYYRRRKAVSLPAEWEEQLPDPASATDHEILQADVARRVRHCVARLDEDQREVIELYWFRHLSFREIAQRLGRSEGAVNQLQIRALANLRELVQRGAFEEPLEQISLPDMAPTRHQSKRVRQTPQQRTPLPVQEPQPVLVEQLSFFS